MSAILTERARASYWTFNDFQSPNDCHIIPKTHAHVPRPNVRFPDDNPLPGEDIDRVSYEGPRHLCVSCLSAIGYLVSHNQEVRTYQAAYPDSDPRKDENHPYHQPFTALHHGSIGALARAAERGCHVCRLVWKRCQPDLSEKVIKNMFGTVTATELLFNTWDDVGNPPGDFRMICAFNMWRKNEPRTRHNYVNAVRFQLWPSPEMDRYFLLLGDVSKEDLHTGQTENPGADARDPSDLSSTRSCKELALRWLEDCRSNEDGKHDACNSTRSYRMPTRVLDIGDVQVSGRVRVVTTEDWSSQKEQPQYISLSHRWGDWGARRNLPMLSQSKIAMLQTSGLEYTALPATFKDAVDIASWFYVRYLWIDSLCIIQDSASDWAAEASQMSDVYSGALLNIAASHSPDARGGCFIHRDPAAHEVFKLQFQGQDKGWFVTLDERNMFDWLEREPLSARAWVFQERELSRRILHFTKDEVFWECRAQPSSLKSELWTNGSPLSRDFLGRSSITMASEDQDAVSAADPWNRICEEFSQRKLSFPADKLPAMSGLASRFAEVYRNEEYLAGHWRSTLPHSLLWSIGKPRKSSPRSIPTRPQQYVAPSWSWLSAHEAIEAVSTRKMHLILDVNSVSTTLQTPDPFGSISGACLRVTGLLRQITCMTEPSPFIGHAYRFYAELNTANQENLYVDGNLRKGHHVGFVCGAPPHAYFENRDDLSASPSCRNYHCLFVGLSILPEPGFWQRSIECLLLERVEGEQDGCFRRVGRMTVYDGECALRLRYQTLPGDSFRASEIRDDPDGGDFQDETSSVDLSEVEGNGNLLNARSPCAGRTIEDPEDEAEDSTGHTSSSQGGYGRDEQNCDPRLSQEDVGRAMSEVHDGRRDPEEDDKNWNRFSRVRAPWTRLWSKIEQYWAGADETSINELANPGYGPLSIYDFDIGLENERLEKLVPQTIKLI